MKDNNNLNLNYNRGTLTASISGEIDHHSSKYLRSAIDSALNEHSPDKLILDISGVSFMDSSGLGLVMGRYRITDAAKIALTVKGAPERAMQMFRMSGLERIIKFEEE